MDIQIPFDYKVLCYLNANGLNAIQPIDYLIVYDQQDGTPSLSIWDTEKLGSEPTSAQLTAAVEQVQSNRLLNGNKYMAQMKLTETDWSQYADVNNTAANPHLLNKEEFDAYRLQLRSILVSPSGTVIEFPTIPKALWSE